MFSKFRSTIRGSGEPKHAVAPVEAVERSYAIPTVNFDPKRVTEAIKFDLRNNIKGIREFDETNFDRVYEAALRSISAGNALAILINAIMDFNLPEMTKQRAGEISLSLSKKATALIRRDEQISAGIKYATWRYSGAPCQPTTRQPSANDIRQDAAHRAADGKRYEVTRGMLLNGHLTMPGREEDCKCFSRSVVPGLDR